MATKTDTSQSTDADGTIDGLIQRFDRHLGNDMSIRKAATVYGLLFAYYIFLLVPIVWLMLSSFLTTSGLYSGELIPSIDEYTIANYERVLGDGLFQQYFLNSVIVAAATTLLTLVVAIPAAYSVSRFEYPGRDYVIIGLISSQMLPLVLVLLPLFTIMFRLNLVDSLMGLVIGHTVGALPFAVWLLKGFFDGIPEALDDAAMMDGCNRIQIMYKIIVPLSIPGIAVSAFYAFIASWNDYLFVSILSQSSGTRTLPMGLQLFQTANQVDWGAVTAAAVVTMIPVLLLFAFVQSWLVEGLSNTGTKGS
ncbi:carbohydrate ABC transporter permease [Natronolimnobius sp. AArcel1]|uniref:carbohydrate ABC transporter permease n=1 Tax=Natronolimnobius sp. AArcel1 TaxID=1679093 RepID=UPI0019CFB18B|nr:carbohydrate ABC transporter permease [Natronolimnobius sp. AArcel1]